MKNQKQKVIHSLSELAGYKGARPARPLTPKSKFCSSCGEKMVNIEGTNVWVCHGTNDKGEPCNKRLIIPVPTSVGGLV